MKFHRYLLCFLLPALFFTACQDKKNEPAPSDKTDNTPAPGQMIANVNGSRWTSQTAYVAKANPDGISIYGQSNGKIISITLAGVLKPGQFDAFNYESLNGWYMETNNGSTQTWTSIASRKCLVNITKIDWVAKKMSGTFSFKADSLASSSPTGSFQVTDGAFQDLPINVAAPAATVNMSSLVNNVPWSASGVYISGFPGFYQLTGSDVNGHVIKIYGLPALQPDVYTVNVALYSEPVLNDYQTWSSDPNISPMVNITHFDPVSRKVSGTFAFQADAIGLAGATGTKNITQGAFTDVQVY